MNLSEVAMPSKELRVLAEQKGERLQPYTQIRLTANEHSYWVMNIAGVLYIAREVNSHCKPFYKYIEEQELKNGSGVITHYVQKL